MMKALLITIAIVTILTFSSFEGTSQSIYRSWLHEKTGMCMVLNEKSWSNVSVIDQIKCKVKGDRLKLIWVNNQLFWFWWQRDVLIFKIEKLTADTLILSQDYEKNAFEYMEDSVMTFTAAKEGCK